MRRILALIVLLASAASAFAEAEAPPAEAETPPAEKTALLAPYQWVRTLEEVQDQISHGVEAAHIYMPKLLIKIADEIERAEPSVLLEPRNVRAIIVYVLSGGDGRSLRRLLGLGALTPLEDKIARGAIAYTEGKYSQASEHLTGIDARTLDTSLAGRVALIQSILAYKKDLKAAIALLDLTRLLATGTLVEEAALRRQAVLEAAARDRKRFEMLAFQYFRRFKQSVYADYFKQQFSVAAAGLDYGDAHGKFDRLKTIVETLDERQQASLYVMLAEKAILMGNLPLTRFAASNGADQSKPDSIERVRAELYEASADVVGENTVKAMRVLEAVPAERLSVIDSDLHRAALAVGHEVLRPALPQLESETAHLDATNAEHGGGGGHDSKPAADTPQAAGETKDAAETDPVVEKAKKAIATADQILSNKKQ